MDTIPQDTPMKQCNACEEWYPATTAYFHKGSKYNKMGLSTKCKKCRGKGSNFGIIAAPKEHRDNEKQCSRCNEWLPKNTEYFGRDKGRRDEFNPACKKCLASDRIKRKDKIDRQQKAYQINNKDRVRERNRKRDIRDHEKRRAASRQSYQKHRVKRMTYQRHIRAWKRGIPGTHTAQQIQGQLKRQKYRCYYAACGFSKFELRNGKYIYHIDHTFPLSRVAGTDIPANDMGYLVLACPACNISKKDKFPWEWPEGGRLL